MHFSFILQELGFPGVEVGSHINEWNLDAPELQPVFAVSRPAQMQTLPLQYTLIWPFVYKNVLCVTGVVSALQCVFQTDFFSCVPTKALELKKSYK